MNPAISVIVPFRNAAAYLGDLLESLAAQEFDEPWEVVAVDNRSSDNSGTLARGFASRLSLTVIDAQERANISYARNVGVQVSRGEKLLFIDADDEVSVGYVSAMAAALDSHDLVTSRVDSDTLNPEWVRHAHGEPWQQSGIQVFFDFLPAAGANIGIKRCLFLSLGGFDEQFSTSADIAFSWHAQLSAGIRISFVESAVYRYRYRNTYRALYRQGCSWGSENALLYRHFRHAGMPKRSWRAGLQEWRDVIGGLLTPVESTRPALVVRLGYCVGRLMGSIKHQVVYL